MATTAEHGPLVVSSNLTSTMKSLVEKKSEFPRVKIVKNASASNLQKLEPRMVARRPVKSGPFQGWRAL